MITAIIDAGGDWLFGKGRNDYLKDLNAVAQNLVTRLRSFLGDCFFDQAAGVDWFHLLGSKDEIALNLAVKAVILNTEFITSIVELSIVRDGNRKVTLSYKVLCVFPGFITGSVGLLLTEDGDVLITESGDQIHA